MHWRVMMFAVAVAFLGASVAGQDHSDIESAIDALAATYTEGWNSGDAAACASTYTEDAYSIQITGERFDGRSAIEGNIQETLTRNGSSTIEIVRTSMHVVKPDLVVVDGTWTVSGSSAETRRRAASTRSSPRTRTGSGAFGRANQRSRRHRVSRASLDTDAELESYRERVRAGVFRRTTSGVAPGLVQANVVILPSALASDFRAFCERNPRPCPLLDETEPGEPVARSVAPSADLRTDVPLYRIYRDGELDAEMENILELWRDDLVGFLLGCSFTFESALVENGIPLRHQEEGKVVPMFITNRACEPSGAFTGPMVVSMRPIPVSREAEVRAITGEFPRAHGEPVHVGDPAELGIEDVDRPDFGESVRIGQGEVPAFWACGVTPQAVARNARPELLITHAPGHMLVTDARYS